MIVMSTTPAWLAAGEVAVIDEVEFTVKLAVVSPNFTEEIFVKLVPVIAMESPPAVEPVKVPTDVTVGATASTAGDSHTMTLSSATSTGTNE